MMRLVGLALCVMAMTAALAQAPEPDLKDPAAVGRAYLDACEKWELEVGARLLTRPSQAVGARKRAAEMRFDEQVAKEMLCFPLLHRVRYIPAEPAVVGDECRIPVVATYTLPQTLVLRKQPDGTWKVDLHESVLTTTGDTSATLVRTELEECLSHLRHLATAMLQYAQDYDGVLPHADKWCDEIRPYMSGEEILKCPEKPDLECGYAFNVELSGMAMDKIERPSETILLIDSDQGKRNGSGPLTAMPKPGRHDGGNVAVYADGHAKWQRNE